MRVLRFLLLLVLLVGARGASAQDLLPPEQAFRASARAGHAGEVVVRFEVAPGYYLYRDKLKFVIEPQREPPAEVRLPPGRIIEDEFFGRVETYRGRVEARLELSASPRSGPVRLAVDAQGCADIGVCYPVFRQHLTVAQPAGKP